MYLMFGNQLTFHAAYGTQNTFNQPYSTSQQIVRNLFLIQIYLMQSNMLFFIYQLVVSHFSQATDKKSSLSAVLLWILALQNKE